MTDTNIENFSIDNLLELLDLKKPATRTEIHNKINDKIELYGNKTKFKSFYEKIKNKLFKHLDDNNLETIFGKETDISTSANILQYEDTTQTNPVYTTTVIEGNINPLKRRIIKDKHLINTTFRKPFLINIKKCKNDDNTIELCDLKNILDDEISQEINDLLIEEYSNIPDLEIIRFTESEVHKFIGGMSRENLKKILKKNEILKYHTNSNPSFEKTVQSFNVTNCKSKYDENLNRCVHEKKEEIITEINIDITSGKNNCGNTNNEFIKTFTENYESQFESIRPPLSYDRQYEENASNFIHNFNVAHSNIIKITLVNIKISKNDINLFVPGKYYYMDVEIDSNITSLEICVSFGKDKLSDVLNQINNKININIFTNINDSLKSYDITLPEDVTSITFKDTKSCTYLNSLSRKLNLFNETITNNNTKIINFPKYLYFVFDDMTNSYHNTYHASVQDSYLSSSILAMIPLVNNNYIIDNTNVDQDLYSREYFGKVNIEKARIQLLDENGDLVNINQTNKIHSENQYYLKLLLERIYDL